MLQLDELVSDTSHSGEIHVDGFELGGVAAGNAPLAVNLPCLNQRHLLDKSLQLPDVLPDLLQGWLRLLYAFSVHVVAPAKSMPRALAHAALASNREIPSLESEQSERRQGCGDDGQSDQRRKTRRSRPMYVRKWGDIE
jgi:hypothetical protein